MSEEKNLDLLDSDQLLQMDLGKNVYAIFDLIESLRVDLSDVSVPDLDFYREKIQEARGYATTVREEIGKVLRARTRAQTRLTARQNRWEIMMSSMLEKDDSVKGGTSIEDRKARAANKMVDLKNAISASKTEVEALKNVKMALDISLRDFNSQCADYKEQAKLVQEEGSRIKRLPPNGNYDTSKEEEELSKSLKSVEDGYKVDRADTSYADEEVVEGGLEVPDTWSDPEEETDEYEESVDSDSEDEDPSGEKDSADELISEMMSGFSESEKDIDEESRDKNLEDEVDMAGFTLPGGISLDEFEIDSDNDSSPSSEEGVGKGHQKDSSLGEEEEKDLEKDEQSLELPEEELEGMELDFDSGDYEVDEVVTTDPKVSKHFKENTSGNDGDPGSESTEEVTYNESSEKIGTSESEKNDSSYEEEDSIDSLLKDLGV